MFSDTISVDQYSNIAEISKFALKEAVAAEKESLAKVAADKIMGRP